MGALRQAVPERVPARSAGEMLMIAFGGKRADGARFVIGELIAGGSGAERRRRRRRRHRDRRHQLHEPAGRGASRWMRRSACTASRCGRIRAAPGAYRGGLGVISEYEILDGEVSLHPSRRAPFLHRARQDGGSAGAKARSVIRRADGREEVIPSKMVTTLNKGDRVVVETAGGGGYGDPHGRPGEQVREDVRNGKVSEEAARSVYGQARQG